MIEHCVAYQRHYTEPPVDEATAAALDRQLTDAEVFAERRQMEPPPAVVEPELQTYIDYQRLRIQQDLKLAPMKGRGGRGSRAASASGTPGRASAASSAWATPAAAAAAAAATGDTFSPAANHVSATGTPGGASPMVAGSDADDGDAGSGDDDMGDGISRSRKSSARKKVSPMNKGERRKGRLWLIG